jgi:hypothetical protein
MSIQKNLLFCVGILTGIGAFSQNRFNQSFGLMGSRANISGHAQVVTDSSMVNSDYQLRLLQFGIVYYPRIDLLQWTSGSISIGAPVMAGVSASGKYRSTDFDGTKTTTVEGVKGMSFTFDIPIVADLNIGLHSAMQDKGKFGFYVGAGYGYSYTKIRTSVGRIIFDGFDPVVRAGLRMGRAWQTRWTLGFTVRGSGANNSIRTYALHILKDI